MNIITILLFFSYITFTISQPKVKVGEATVIGTFMRTRKGRQISAFRGIPYAEKPLGNLRFRNPVPKKLINGTIIAIKDGHMCVQFWVLNKSADLGDEDCLYLNVYTPLLVTNQEKNFLPVMVFIHGGAYLSGSSSSLEYGPEYLLDNDVVLVTMNYRLGMLGFLTTGDGEAPGNFGLKDQVVALKWVRSYIYHFGGNRQKVTLFGLSAGSNCVHFHTMSDLSNGLFRQFILQSGDAISYRSFQERKKYSKFAWEVGKLFSCPSNSSKLLVDCLRNVEAMRLRSSISVFNKTRQLFELTWTPTNEPKIDGAFITDTPYNSMRKRKRKDYPWIAGMTRNEGLYFLRYLHDDATYKKNLGNLDSFLKDLFKTFPFPLVADVEQVIKDIRAFYFTKDVVKKKELVLQTLSDLLGDLFRYRSQCLLSDHHFKTAKKRLFLYNFDYRGTVSFTSLSGTNKNVGVFHGDESLYIFPMGRSIYKKFKVEISKDDLKMIDIMVDLWTSFATYGVPNTTHVSNPKIWKPNSPGNNILIIGNISTPELSIVNTLFKERMEFWSSRMHTSI